MRSLRLCRKYWGLKGTGSSTNHSPPAALEGTSPGFQQPIEDMIDVGELGFCLGAQPFVSKGDGRSISKAAHAGGQSVVVDQMLGLLHGFSLAAP